MVITEHGLDCIEVNHSLQQLKSRSSSLSRTMGPVMWPPPRSGPEGLRVPGGRGLRPSVGRAYWAGPGGHSLRPPGHRRSQQGSSAGSQRSTQPENTVTSHPVSTVTSHPGSTVTSHPVNTDLHKQHQNVSQVNMILPTRLPRF